MSNIDTVNGAYAAFAKSDIPGLLDLLSDNIEWNAPLTLPHGGRFSGKDGVSSFFAGIGANWSSLNLELHGVADLATAPRMCSRSRTGRSRTSRSTPTLTSHSPRTSPRGG